MKDFIVLSMAMAFGVFLALWLASLALTFDVNVVTPLQLESVDVGDGVVDRDGFPVG